MATPIPWLELAIAAKVDFVNRTNPWGPSDGKTKAAPRDTAPSKRAPAAAAKSLFGFLRQQAAKAKPGR